MYTENDAERLQNNILNDWIRSNLKIQLIRTCKSSFGSLSELTNVLSPNWSAAKKSSPVQLVSRRVINCTHTVQRSLFAIGPSLYCISVKGVNSSCCGRHGGKTDKDFEEHEGKEQSVPRRRSWAVCSFCLAGDWISTIDMPLQLAVAPCRLDPPRIWRASLPHFDIGPQFLCSWWLKQRKSLSTKLYLPISQSSSKQTWQYGSFGDCTTLIKDWTLHLGIFAHSLSASSRINFRASVLSFVFSGCISMALRICSS